MSQRNVMNTSAYLKAFSSHLRPFHSFLLLNTVIALSLLLITPSAWSFSQDPVASLLNPALAEQNSELQKLSFCQPWSDPKACDPTPHVIFLVHGLMSTHNTFKDLKSILYHEYGTPKMTSSGRLRKGKHLFVVDIEYPTKPEELDGYTFPKEVQDQLIEKVGGLHPIDFAKIMNTKVIYAMISQGAYQGQECNKRFAQDNEKKRDCLGHIINVSTPYSVIAHSQGGVISMAYLNTCLYRNTTHNECDYEEGLNRMLEIYQPLDGLKKLKDIKVLNSFQALERYSALSLKSESIQLFNANTSDKSQAFNPLKEDDSGKIKTPQNYKNFITIATPFWGSSMANAAVMNVELINNSFLANYLPPQQIIQLGIASRVLSWQRFFVMNRLHLYDFDIEKEVAPNTYFTKWQNPYGDLQVYTNGAIIDHAEKKWLAIAKKIGGDMILKSVEHENDMVVSAPESRLDFIYYIEDYNTKEDKVKKYYGRTQLSQSHYIFNQSHIPFGLLGVHGINEFYQNKSGYHYKENPSYTVISKALDKEFGFSREGTLNYQEKSFLLKKEKLLKSVKNFTSEIKFVTPIGYHRPFAILNDEHLTDNVLATPGNVRTKVALEDSYISRSRFALPLFQKTFGQNPFGEKVYNYYWQSYYHIGRFRSGVYNQVENQNVQNEEDYFYPNRLSYNLDYNVNIIGFERRQFKVNIMPSYTSYSEVLLKPYLGPFNDFENSEDVEAPHYDEKVIAQIPLGNSLVRVVSMNHDGEYNIKTLKSHQLHSPSVCQVGLVGELTPENFKQPLEDGFEDQDYINNGMSLIISRTKQPILWHKYARNQNLSYKSFDEEMFTQEPYVPDFLREAFEEGEPIEVYGRYTIGHVDKFSKVGHTCTPYEKTELKYQDCEIRSIDRFLVTSPRIQLLDGVSDISQLGEVTNMGHLRGLRWINVVDVNLIKNDESLLVKSHSYFTKQIQGNQCLFMAPRIDYQTPEYYRDHYYYRNEGLVTWMLKKTPFSKLK